MSNLAPTPINVELKCEECGKWGFEFIEDDNTHILCPKHYKERCAKVEPKHYTKGGLLKRTKQGNESIIKVLHSIAFLYSQKSDGYKPSIAEVNRLANLSAGNIDYAVAKLLNIGVLKKKVEKSKTVPPYKSEITILKPAYERKMNKWEIKAKETESDRPS